MIKDQDPHHSQIENDETPVVQYPNENNSEDIETNKTSAIPKLQILKDDEITKGVNSQIKKKRKFSMWSIPGAKIN